MTGQIILVLNIATLFISPFNCANFAEEKKERKSISFWIRYGDTVRRTQVSCPHHTYICVARSIAGDVAVFDLLSPHCPFSHSPFYEGKKGEGRTAQRLGPREGERGWEGRARVTYR